jgi:3-hydroxyacyl-CoA dehydrogenase/enoyl-CoA hydratase/3-hydroxybutyryl-CoA epimerase
MADTAWTYSTDEQGIGTLSLDVPGRSANTLSIAVLEALSGVLQQLEAAPPRGLLIRSTKPSGFIAGADINEFARVASEDEALQMVRRGQHLFDRIEALPCPTVALLRGFALGGGLELAMSCTYRVAVDDGSLALGLPEVQLGIHPGFGGSVRAVRLLGVRPAMELMLTGRSVRADKVLRLGLVDRVVSVAQAEAACRELLLKRPPPHKPPLLERLLSWPVVRAQVGRMLRAQLQRKVKAAHYPAPYALVDSWVESGAHGQQAFEVEARSVGRLFRTGTARHLVRVFLLQDRLKALGGKDPAALVPRRVHVVGAGVMGGDIAAWCALRGLEVTLQDRSAEQVQPALTRAVALFDKRLRDPKQKAAAAARLQMDIAGEGIAGADVVIEAIYENLQAKHELLQRLETAMKPEALLATNTSSLTLESLATVLQEPGRLVGLHFFNPVAQMPLVEVVSGVATTDAVRTAALRFARQLDRLPLPCRSSPGFLVNRVLAPYLLEALIALEQGIAPELIDAAATDWGMPMGPIELADVVGLDVCRKVGETVGQLSGRPPPLPLTRIETLIGAGKLGRKNGQGFYAWVDGKPVKAHLDRNRMPPDLQDRLVLALVNESKACEREGIVADADLVDGGLVFGAGFAPFRGGPLAWAADTGVTQVTQRLQQLVRQHGERFTPDTGWSV